VLRSLTVSLSRETRTLLALAAAAFVVRVAFITLEPGSKLAGDEWTWYRLAVGHGGVASEKMEFSPLRNRHILFYPPGYPYFIGAVHMLAGGVLASPDRDAPLPPPPRAVKYLQAALGAALVLVIGRIGAGVFGLRTGMTAAIVTALYPDLVWLSAHYWSETLFLALMWWAMERVLAADGGEGIRRSLAAGLVWGLAVLTRETALYFMPVAAAWLAWGRAAEGRRRAAAFAAATLLIVAPWTYRNWKVFGAFIPVSIQGGQNLFQGNTPIERDTTYEIVGEAEDQVEGYRKAMRLGIRAILDRQPWWIFEKLRDEMPNFWEADNLALIHIKRGRDDPPGGYGPHTTVTAAWLAAAVTLLPYLLVLAAFVIGVRDLPLTRPVVLLLLFLLYTNAIHIVTHGFARYRLPAIPVVFLIAGWGLCAAAAERRSSRGRRALAAAIALVLVACVIPSLRKTASHPAFGGRGTDAIAPADEGAAP
jgi:hypothetical protein